MNEFDKPLFSATELAKVAGIERKLINLWIERGKIIPTRTEQLTSRKRYSFSVSAIFMARLTKVLSDRLEINAPMGLDLGAGVNSAAEPGSAAAAPLERLIKAVADEGWMYACARNIDDRQKPLPILAAISRSNDCWDIFFELDASKFAARFEPSIPYAIVPVGEIFGSVYRECKAIYPELLSRQRKDQPRARS